MRGASDIERAPAALAGEAIDEKGNHSSFRGYLYTQLRRYISLYVRPTDRLVEISTSKLTQSLSLQTDRTLLLGAGPSGAHILATSRSSCPNLSRIMSCSTVACIMSETCRDYSKSCARVCLLPAGSSSSTTAPCGSRCCASPLHCELRRKTPEENWIANEDIWNLLLLAGYELLRHESKLLMPIYIPLVSYLVNRFLAPLPGFSLFNLLNIAVARPLENPRAKPTQTFGLNHRPCAKRSRQHRSSLFRGPLRWDRTTN